MVWTVGTVTPLSDSRESTDAADMKEHAKHISEPYALASGGSPMRPPSAELEASACGPQGIDQLFVVNGRPSSKGTYGQ